ncbi:unnamed protein product [Bursaphelenchus okinawaensis]|uniref:F-box domain-containing protein n=1 Tax=Bursaphelenchus okinawaensis TaxID=465554 RepID=A0A811KMQ9_9BILA|nr:unnamed protein product [Bursaphelenchus okinawaensis]CAG9107875.1 unnamed protein product [Bursaphelenchus okinawaensis]
MEDICSLAMVNKCFYKLVNLDFKKLCYHHVVYRLKDETWAYAFSKFGDRSYYISGAGFYHEHSVCCPFTGKMAITLKNGYVILNNIDFCLKQFTIVDFTLYFMVYNKRMDCWQIKPSDLNLQLKRNSFRFSVADIAPLPHYRVMEYGIDSKWHCKTRLFEF